MKRFAVFILMLSCLYLMLSAAPATVKQSIKSRIDRVYTQVTGKKPLQAKAAVLMDQRTGTVLYKKKADTILYPASTTKILTALLVIEHLEPEAVITIGREIERIQPRSSTAGLVTGRQITGADLIMAMLLPSGNDAAYAAAVAVGRTITGNPSLEIDAALETFMERMNDRAAAIGCTRSNFMNPDGYHHEQHYTTAYDIALIAREAMGHAVFREAVRTQYHIPEEGTGSREAMVWQNRNELLNKESMYYYQDATGLKTGYTREAGQCLVSSAHRDDTVLIAVVLNSTQEGRWTDSISLLENGFAQQEVPMDNAYLKSGTSMLDLN